MAGPPDSQAHPKQHSQCCGSQDYVHRIIMEYVFSAGFGFLISGLDLLLYSLKLRDSGVGDFRSSILQPGARLAQGCDSSAQCAAQLPGPFLQGGVAAGSWRVSNCGHLFRIGFEILLQSRWHETTSLFKKTARI